MSKVKEIKKSKGWYGTIISTCKHENKYYFETFIDKFHINTFAIYKCLDCGRWVARDLIYDVADKTVLNLTDFKNSLDFMPHTRCEKRKKDENKMDCEKDTLHCCDSGDEHPPRFAILSKTSNIGTPIFKVDSYEIGNTPREAMSVLYEALKLCAGEDLLKYVKQAKEEIDKEKVI